MGFIGKTGASSKRRRKGTAEKENARPKKRQKPELPARNDHQSNESIYLETLPIEVMQYIFVLSKNFSLPESSKTLWSILNGSRALKRHMIEMFKQKDHIPVDLCSRKFVTAELLKEAEVTGFYNDQADSSVSIPENLVTKPITDRKIRLLEFMLQTNCQINGASDLIEWAVEEKNDELVEKYLSLGVSFDHSALISALEVGNRHITDMLVNSKQISLNDMHLWECVFKKRDEHMFHYLREAGGTPPYDILASATL